MMEFMHAMGAGELVHELNNHQMQLATPGLVTLEQLIRDREALLQSNASRNQAGAAVTVKLEPGATGVAGSSMLMPTLMWGRAVGFDRITAEWQYRPETEEERHLRFWCQQYFERVLRNHVGLYRSAKTGDIGALVKVVTTLCAGTEGAAVVGALDSMFALKAKATSTEAPTLLAEVARLHAVFLSVKDPGWTMPTNMLPYYALRAMSEYPHLAIALNEIRRLPTAEVTVPRITQELTCAHVEAPPAAIQAMYAGRAAGKAGKGGGAPKQCFSYRDKGSCSYGDDCKFSHAGAAGGGDRAGSGRSADACYYCGKAGHGVSACPEAAADRGARQQAKDAAAREATLKAENALLVQQLTAARSVTALSATADPYSVYGAGAGAVVNAVPPPQAGGE